MKYMLRKKIIEALLEAKKEGLSEGKLLTALETILLAPSITLEILDLILSNTLLTVDLTALSPLENPVLIALIPVVTALFAVLIALLNTPVIALQILVTTLFTAFIALVIKLLIELKAPLTTLEMLLSTLLKIETIPLQIAEKNDLIPFQIEEITFPIAVKILDTT